MTSRRRVDGYESPWGSVQLILIADSSRVTSPPVNPAALLEWSREHPGRFTFDMAFTGLTFLKSLMIGLSTRPADLYGPFNEQVYERNAARLWHYLKELKPWMWKKGETYPATVARMHQLFRAGEIDFSMSNNDGELDIKVAQGVLPNGSYGFVLETGTIRNSHYVGIPTLSRSKAGAMVVANFLLSEDAQVKKLDPLVWGDGSVLDVDRMSEDAQLQMYVYLDNRRSPRSSNIVEYALPELAPEYMIRLSRDFRTEILQASSADS